MRSGSVERTRSTCRCCRCSSYTAQPASQCLHRSSVSRIGNAAARGAASCGQSFFWKRLTDGGDRCEGAERTIHVQHVKEARSQTCNSQTGIPLQRIVYCNKEHQSYCTRFLYTNTLISRTCDLLSFLIGTLRRHRLLPWALHVPSDHYAAAKPTDL